MRFYLAGFGFFIDKIIYTDYIESTDEVFTYDDLDNPLTLNTRGDQDVAYLHNVANEYTSSSDQSVWTVGRAYGSRGVALRKRGPRAVKPPLPRGGSVRQCDAVTLTTTRYYYDASGNLSADNNGYTYEYDNDNRLTKIKLGRRNPRKTSDNHIFCQEILIGEMKLCYINMYI